MKVSYRAPAGMLSWASKRALIAVGLLVLPITLCFDKATETTPPKVKPNLPVLHQPDPRAVRLQKFLSRLQCPVSNLADEFIRAADENGLDWRLLPSIAVMESGGGKVYRNNNIFGWGNGNIPFKSLESGIHEVAFRLGRSPLYRGHDVEAKLHIYNPNEDYARTVMVVMRRISPAVHIEPTPSQAQVGIS